MASIAETAEMSAGLIYRYFENKNAIIQAIVERQLQLLSEDIRLIRQVDLAPEMARNYGTSGPGAAPRLRAAPLPHMSAEPTRAPPLAAPPPPFHAPPRTPTTHSPTPSPPPPAPAPPPHP